MAVLVCPPLLDKPGKFANQNKSQEWERPLDLPVTVQGVH